MNEVSPNIVDISALLKDAYARFKAGQFESAVGVLERALAVDYEHPEILTAMKSAHFWLDRLDRIEEIDDDFERGEYLFKQWSVFCEFLEGEADSQDRGVYAVRQWVFGRALGSFLRVHDGSAGSDPDLLHRIGRCYKGKGDYKQALEYFEACSRQRSDDPQVLAQLADCYAFINEMKASKVFFREAFFLDPQRIELPSLECTMMHRLIDQVRSEGREGPALPEWVPVYGVVFGVFNVKRELRSLEYGKLKQSIYALESRIAEEGRNDVALEPRLLNRYFWLIDHYLAVGDDREKVDEILGKIRTLNPIIYEQYTN